MAGSLLDDAFAHHAWATVRLLDSCARLCPEQLEMAVPGTYGSVIETMRHLVDGDSTYLFWLTGDRSHLVDARGMDVAQLKTAIQRNGVSWSAFVAKATDAEQVTTDVDEESGWRRTATVGLRLAQALHHGSDHRSQVCTALTTLGIEPPSLDLWDFGVSSGRILEHPPAS